MKNLNNFAIMAVTPGSTFDQSGNGELLCIATKGYFASSAWIESDERFNEVIGSSFGVITGDDGMEYKEDKYKFSRPSLDKIQELLPKCDSYFIQKANEILAN